MKLDERYALALQTYAELGVALQKCRSVDSHEGEKISAKEFSEDILPLHHKAESAIRELYKEIILEHAKDTEILMAKCIQCDKFNDKDCPLYNGLSGVNFEDFKTYIERNSALCIEGVDNTFYMPDGEAVGSHLRAGA